VTKHFRAHLLLIVLTFAICSVAYPLVVWAVGRVAFPTAAAGSLVTAVDGRGGSRLIGQNFNGDEYFQPRPSAAGNGYDAKASSGSNWGVSNPKLRDRVARLLGPVARFSSDPTNGDRAGKPVGPVIVEWAAANPQRVAAWARDHPGKALPVDYIEIQRTFFDLWLQDNQTAILDKVPADMVMASGSGLDPHITLPNALYQLDRVAGAWAAKAGGAAAAIKMELEGLVRGRAAAPLFGLAGEPLVNVLELNLAVRERMQR
jgi:K+-transporting ATPase ATPase C chain